MVPHVSPEVIAPEATRDLDRVDIQNLVFWFRSGVAEGFASLGLVALFDLLRPPVYRARDVTTLQLQTRELIVVFGGLFALGSLACLLGGTISGLNQVPLDDLGVFVCSNAVDTRGR